MTSTTQPPPVSPPELDRAVPECPYVGLVPFDESDAPYFFGRQCERDVIVANLSTSRLTLLYAASGVGKSSVLRAGVLPRLRQIATESYADLDDPDAAVAYVREWSLAPLDTIARAVLDAVSRVPGARSFEVPGPPRLSAPWLRDVIQRSDVAAVYLILDQFEEYFRYHPDDAAEDGLVGELGRILCIRDLQVNVLLSIREDALAELDRFKGWVPHLYDNYLRLTHLGRDAAREAIEGPLDHYNQVVRGPAMTVEPELTEALLDQIRTGQLVMTSEGAAPGGAAAGRGDIETPFLQLVLTKLWEAERASGSSVLRRSTLDRLGGAQKIVEDHLHTVMAGLAPEQREVAAKVLRYLVTESGSKNAQTAETLADWSDVPIEAVRELLQSLSAGRQNILRPIRPPAGVAEPPRYEIFHDVLGPAVLDWCHQYLAQRAQRRLVAEREQAQAEAQATRRRLRQTRALAAGLIGVLLIAGAFGWFYYLASGEAKQQRLLSEAAAALSENPVQSLRKAVEAYGINDDAEAREAVLIAASVPRSRVVAGPRAEFPNEPKVAGMVISPDRLHVVTYDTQGGIGVIGDNGERQREAKAFRLAGTVVGAATNPSASHVALATNQGSVAIIDVETGRQVDLTTDGSRVTVVSWIDSAPDNLVLVVTSSGLAATYSANDGQQVTRFPGTIKEALPIANGKVVTAQVVTSDQDLRLRVWDARTAEEAAESSPLPDSTRYLQRYGYEVVGATKDGKIIRWDWQAQPQPRQYAFSFLNNMSQMVVSEDNNTATIALDKTVMTYNLDTGSPQYSLPQQPGTVNGVALDPRGQWIATAGADGRVRVWSARKGSVTPNRATYDLIAHRGGVQSVSYLQDGKALISLGLDGTVRLWEIPQVQRLDLHNDWVVDLDLSADRRWLATASYDGKVCIVDFAHASIGTVAATVPVDDYVEDARVRLKNVQFDPTDPHRIITLTRSGEPGEQLKGWRWSSGRPAEPLLMFEARPGDFSGSLVSLDISQDGTRVAAGDSGGNVYFWDAHTGKRIDGRAISGSGQSANGIAFDPSGQLLAATGSNGILLKKLDAQEEPKLLEFPDVTTVAFDPRGEHIVGGANGVLRVWTRDGQHQHDLVAHGSTVGSPSFSDDGTLVAVGTGEGLIEVWNVDSGRRVMLARQHGDSVNDVLFLPGSESHLVSASDDSTVAVFKCGACKDQDVVIRDAKRWVKESN